MKSRTKGLHLDSADSELFAFSMKRYVLSGLAYSGISPASTTSRALTLQTVP